MGKCAKRAFENGGSISKADQLMAEMAAKYGTTGAAQAAPVQQPAPPPPKAQPAPQPQGITSGIMGILKGRQQQIDKAAGYRNGGRPGGGIIRGPGTPTSDSIDAAVKETGEPIKVSTEERIVSKAQEGVLQEVAKGIGYENLDQMLEATTGQPVGPTIKAGKRAAASGLSPEEEQRRIDMFSATPPTLGTGLNGMVRTNPDTNFVTGAAPGVAPTPLIGRNAAGIITADSAKAATAEPMQRTGGIVGSYDGKGVNDIMARENKARGEMIDSMIAANGGNGIAVLPDRSDEINQQMVLNKLSPVERATYELGRGRNDATVAQLGLTSRAQDLDYRKASNHDATIMRGQDINAQTDAARVGLEGKRLGLAQNADERAADRWNVERPGIVAQAKDSDAVRSARQGLMDAIASGDQKRIEQARTTAIAAGVKFDKPTDNFDFKTGPMGNVAIQQLPDGGASITTFGIDGKPKPAVTIPAPGARQAVQAPADALAHLKQNPNLAAAFKSKYGYLPEGF